MKCTKVIMRNKKIWKPIQDWIEKVDIRRNDPGHEQESEVKSIKRESEDETTPNFKLDEVDKESKNSKENKNKTMSSISGEADIGRRKIERRK